MNRPSWIMIVILVLAGIGIVSNLTSMLTYLIVPIILIAIIYFAYRFSSKRGTSKRPRIKKSAKTEAKIKAMKSGNYPPVHKVERKRSTADLKVIDGNKSKPKS